MEYVTLSNGVKMEAWAPFGEGRGGLFENPLLKEIGGKLPGI